MRNVLLTAALALGLAACTESPGPTAPTIAPVAAPQRDLTGTCGETSCVPITAAYISHFTDAGCTGTESYYTAYNGYDGIRRSWDGGGIAGTVLRTVTNRSYKDAAGICHDAWPSGNTLSDFVTVYRAPASVCGEATCEPVTGAYISHFTGAGCTGTESYYTAYNGYDGIRRSWDGQGMVGTTLRTVTNRSFKDASGICHDAWPSGNTLSDFVTVYRGLAAPVDPTCGEASCVPVTQAYISHFTGAGCTGTESYYTAYNGYDGIRRSWDGHGVVGTTLRTVTNVSYKDAAGICHDEWPSGNTLSDFVTVYRVPVGPTCGEASCVPVTQAYISHFTGAGCTGTESYYTAYNGYDGVRRSWDGGGIAGTTLRTVTNRSYKYNGVCNDAWPSGNTLSDFVTIYR